MNSQLTYRGLPFHTATYRTIETKQEALFLGRKANVISPVKSPLPVPVDIQFRGRQATPATLERNIVLDIAGWMPV